MHYLNFQDRIYSNAIHIALYPWDLILLYNRLFAYVVYVYLNFSSFEYMRKAVDHNTNQNRKTARM